MNRFISSNLLVFCLIAGSNLNAKKECIQCGNIETNKKMINSNDLDHQITLIIEAAFQAKKVKFAIPKKLENEFNAKKQAILNNLNKKMKSIKTDKVYLPELTKFVDEAFDIFIDRVKYAQLSEEIHLVLSNIKKDPNSPNSSSMFSDKSFRTRDSNQK